MAKEKKPKKEKSEKQGKGGIKKLLIPVLGLIVIAAVAFVVIKIVLPKLGIGGEKAPKILEAYVIGEDSAISLDSIMEEGEGDLLFEKKSTETVEKEEDSSGEKNAEEKYTYIYEMKGFADVMNRYLDIMLDEEGFSLVDENYLVQEERPELGNEHGALVLARASAVEDHIFVLAIGWAESNGTLIVRTSAPEAKLSYPKEPEELEPASLSEQMEQLNTMSPSDLALPGSSMSEYDIYPVEGFVTIDDVICRRFNIYEVGKTGDIAGIIFYSGDMSRIYRMDTEDNSIVTELK